MTRSGESAQSPAHAERAFWGCFGGMQVTVHGYWMVCGETGVVGGVAIVVKRLFKLGTGSHLVKLREVSYVPHCCGNI